MRERHETSFESFESTSIIYLIEVPGMSTETTNYETSVLEVISYAKEYDIPAPKVLLAFTI